MTKVASTKSFAKRLAYFIVAHVGRKFSKNVTGIKLYIKSSLTGILFNTSYERKALQRDGLHKKHPRYDKKERLP